MSTFKTETGSTYEVDGLRMRRLTPTHEMRRDGEWLNLLRVPPAPEVGAEMVFFTEPLGEGALTIRRTSRVTEVLA